MQETFESNVMKLIIVLYKNTLGFKKSLQIYCKKNALLSIFFAYKNSV